MLRDSVSIAHSPERTSSSRGPLSFARTYWGPPWWLRVSSDYSTPSWICRMPACCVRLWVWMVSQADSFKPHRGPEDAQMALAWQSQEWLPRVIPQGHPTWPWQWRTLGNKALLSISLCFSSLLYSAQSGKFDALKRNDFYSKKIKTKKLPKAFAAFEFQNRFFSLLSKQTGLRARAFTGDTGLPKK